MKKGDISASVVLYGGAEEARRCLESLAEHTECGVDLYLVDNASPDGALEKLQEGGLPDGVRILPQKKNEGYGAGHNKVLPYLTSKYHAIVNPDILLRGDVLSVMAEWMERHPQAVITTPRLIFPDGEQQNIAKRRPALLPLVARQFGWQCLKKYEDYYLMLDQDLSKPTEVEFCSGSFCMLRTDVYKEIGGFDEGYFMYVEDADLTQKARRKGKAFYLPQVTVVHAWHRAAHNNFRQFLWQVRSMIRYFRKWGFRWV